MLRLVMTAGAIGKPCRLSLPGRRRACPGHPGSACSVPCRSGSPGQARRRQRHIIWNGRKPLQRM